MNRLDRLERKMDKATKRPGGVVLFLTLEGGNWFLSVPGQSRTEYETEDEARTAADDLADEYSGEVSLIYDDCNQ